VPRKFLKRVLPKEHDLRREGTLRLFGSRLRNRELWHLSRNSVAGAVSVGLFCACVPVPGQMVLAAGAAVLLGYNLAIAVVSVWITNPITAPPIFFAAYKLGAHLLDRAPRAVEFEMSMDWFLSEFGVIWEPLLLGGVILGLLSAVVGNLVVRGLWRLHVIRRWKERQARRSHSAI
jgi:uncharacterized protein (DUF2062 family)